MRTDRASGILFVVCGSVVAAAFLPLALFADVAADQRASLERQLAEVQKEIQQNQAQLATQQKQRASLERDVAILDSQIQEAQLEIKQRNLTITKIKNGIAEKRAGIRSLDSQVVAGQESLAQILRQTREIDETPLVLLALGGSLSDLFQDIDNFQTIQQSLGEAFTKMAAQRSDLSAREQALQEEQQEEQDLLQIQVLQQNALKAREKQKQNLVTAARGQESIYQQIIANKRQSAASIEAALFSLRDTSAVSFGDMYSYAKEASAKTGVRPAFILAVLSQESDLGQNIGSCYVTSLETGDGVGKNTGTFFQKVMKAPRDTQPFKSITQEFGLSWPSTPVSCPFGKVYTASRGYGGAMGPAQFIPSTWQLYEARIARATGQAKANPWDPRTATFATAIYVADLGADDQTSSAERRAALRYFAGSNWQNPSYRFYGDQVMEKAAGFQSQISILGG